MSADLRDKAQRLRAKYARVFDVDISLVEYRILDTDDDVEIFAQGLPVWTLGDTRCVTQSGT